MIFLCFLSSIVLAKDDGRYANSPNKLWYETQHDQNGAWCCNTSDGEGYQGDYTINQDGSVTLSLKTGPRTIAPYKVINVPNPTGNAVWWHVGATDYCFALGSLL